MEFWMAHWRLCSAFIVIYLAIYFGFGLGGLYTMVEYVLSLVGFYFSSIDSDLSCVTTMAVCAQSFELLLPSLYFALALPLGCRRLHDVGMSGWWQLLYCAPFLVWLACRVAGRLHDFCLIGWWPLDGLLIAGVLAAIVLFCRDSQRGANKYGSSEKYPD